MSIFKSIGKGIEGIGKGVSAGLGAASSATKIVGKTVGKVPVVGGGLKAAVSLGSAPIRLTASIASGERIDTAVVNNIKQQVRDIKTAGPYAQMVVSLVPGVGTGVGAAIAAGTALAEGQPITAALAAGVRGAIPGGAIATATFDVSTAALQGKSLSQAAINALPLTPAQKRAVGTVVSAAQKVASGQRVDTAIANSAMKQLPLTVQKSLAVGIAVGAAITVQSRQKKAVRPKVLNALSIAGKKAIAISKPAAAGLKAIKDPKMKAGFTLGASVAKSRAKPFTIAAIRTKLTAPQKKGFDVAVAAHAGSKAEIPESIRGNATAEFAYQVTKGAEALTDAAQTSLIEAMAQNPELRVGVEAAANDSSLKVKFVRVIIKVLKAFEKNP